MKLQQLRTVLYLATNTCIIAGFTIGVATPKLAHADIVVTPCPHGGAPIFTPDGDYYCGDPGGGSGPGQGGGGGGGNNGGGGEGGSGGGGGNGGATPVPEKAPDSCHDIEELSTPAANVAFKAYWETNLKPRVVPDGKTYTITFSDGSKENYVWNQIISSSYAVNPAPGATCHG